MSLESEYKLACITPSDIFEHIPTLRALADQVRHVTEMGTRLAVSTRAFLASKAAVVRAYDLGIHAGVPELFEQARQEGKDAQIISANVLEIEIKATDLLFIDTLHTYDQCRDELRLHGHRAQRYLVFHDTQTFGTTGEVAGTVGLLPAIREYLEGHSEWRIILQLANCNGLTVLERV